MTKQAWKFLFDRMLGRLCRKMRMLGFDARLNGKGETGRFFLNAQSEGRIAVTRCRRRDDPRPGPAAIVLRTETTGDQIAELFESIGGTPEFEPFTRCLECNALLAEAGPSDISGKVPPYIEKTFTSYHICPRCGRVYWEGTHFQAMMEEVDRIRGKSNN